MVFLKIENNKVEFIHYMPFHEKHGLGKTQEELKQEGILVDSIPEPEQLEGKVAILYCNPETKELWYEYEDVLETDEELQKERVEQLEQQLQITQEAIDFLIMMGGI